MIFGLDAQKVCIEIKEGLSSKKDMTARLKLITEFLLVILYSNTCEQWKKLV